MGWGTAIVLYLACFIGLFMLAFLIKWVLFPSGDWSLYVTRVEFNAALVDFKTSLADQLRESNEYHHKANHDRATDMQVMKNQLWILLEIESEKSEKARNAIEMMKKDEINRAQPLPTE